MVGEVHDDAERGARLGLGVRDRRRLLRLHLPRVDG